MYWQLLTRLARSLQNMPTQGYTPFDGESEEIMKKIISTFLMLTMLSMVSILPNSTMAATAATASNAAYSESGAIAPCPAGYRRVRASSVKRSTRLWNTLIAAGIGTALGAGIGGKRGALIGAGSGAGGYIVYRYVKDRRGRCVPQYIRRG